MAGETGDGGWDPDCGIEDPGFLTLTRAAAKRSRKSESNDISLGVLEGMAVSASLSVELDIWELGSEGTEMELRWPGEMLCRLPWLTSNSAGRLMPFLAQSSFNPRLTASASCTRLNG